MAIEKICLNCGKEFKVYPYRKDEAKYCSRKCSRGGNKEQFMGKNNPAWKGGIAYEPYSNLFNQQTKEKIRVRDNFICQECGIPELECSRRLDIHHIDYNKKNTNDDNLISLCQSCHGKTQHNREFWIKHFMKEIYE